MGAAAPPDRLSLIGVESVKKIAKLRPRVDTIAANRRGVRSFRSRRWCPADVPSGEHRLSQRPPAFERQQAQALAELLAADVAGNAGLFLLVDHPRRALERAVQKTGDLLAMRPGTRTGLVAYAGSPHLVMPLTTDPDVITYFAAALAPELEILRQGRAETAVRVDPLALLDEFKDNPNAHAWLWKDHTGYAEAAEITELAEKDERVVAITSAMCDGTGLMGFRKKFPNRFYDVGIAESAAVDIAAGLGDEVRVLGLSMDGVVAAWTAQERSDVDRVVAISPALTIPFVPVARARSCLRCCRKQKYTE